MPRLARTALAATFLTAVSTQAFAADLVIWWNKSYYPEEDQQFDKTVAAFEKEIGHRRRVRLLHQRGRAA